MTFETKINDRIKAAWKEGYAEGFAIGYAEGFAEVRMECLISLVRENLISVEIAAEKSGLSVEEFMQKMDAASACEAPAEYSAKQP